MGQWNQPGMLADGITPKAAITEQHGLPECIHFWQVGVPIDRRHLIKNETQQLVISDFFVESINQADDFRFAFYIRNLSHNMMILSW